MEEVSENSVTQEVAPLETNQHEEPKKELVQREVQEDSQERNWRATRNRISELEKELKRKEELLEKVISRVEPQPQKMVQEEPEEPDEEYIPKGKVKRLARKEVEPLEQKLERLEQEIQRKNQYDLINGLRTRYNDFDDVVNADTLAILEEKEPELAKTIEDLKDPYKIGLQAYKIIKSFGLMNEVPGKRRVKDVEKKIEQNAKTVQSPQAYDKRPMAQAYRMSSAEKSALYDEMTRYGSMVSSVPEMS
jgi:hypothetical protein